MDTPPSSPHSPPSSRVIRAPSLAALSPSMLLASLRPSTRPRDWLCALGVALVGLGALWLGRGAAQPPSPVTPLVETLVADDNADDLATFLALPSKVANRVDELRAAELEEAQR